MTEPRQIRLLMELRTLGVQDSRVLSAIERVPREAFVPPQFIDQAYENTALPIGEGQTISQPLVVGLMTQALELDKRMKVLEIGTGSGYQAAVLAKLARRVYSIERHASLLAIAEKRFHQLRITNITARAGDGAKGWPEQAPFPRIIATAAATRIPEALIEQLAVGGLMVIPVGDRASDQNVVRVTRTETGCTTETLFPVRFVPLVSNGTEKPKTA
ncbi:MAG TPA: protein-L-isoaspartate(D-aspartate) O-methyltransferase [Alphaproteobacteria bacterium]|jgi:protein-L-isoaspartate(D-aspartate) O-methyltransferase|nr:protein-L-isoaspartate(D-aspartate) O-methyltransferase [Alphaproteobacteria bacterium]